MIADGTRTDSELDNCSIPFVGRWNRLVSLTNWEKGKIIHEWRTALVDEGAPASEYSDEAWSRRIGNLTGQHVGRLRRVYEQFGDSFGNYYGLFWSHFQAALDWEDAGEWLSKAAEDGFSVAQMRKTRIETLYPEQAEELEAEAELPAEDEDEDAIVSDDLSPNALTGEFAEISSEEEDDEERPYRNDSDEESISTLRGSSDEEDEDQPSASRFESATEAKLSPQSKLKRLPEDMLDAFEQFKISILRHKMLSWEEVPRDDVLSVIDTLKELVLAGAPVHESIEEAPF